MAWAPTSRSMAWCRCSFAIIEMARSATRVGEGRANSGIDFARVHYYAFVVNKIPVGVLGASGYAGRELCALIQRHPALSLAFATANDQRGSTVRLGGRDVTFVASDDVQLASADLIFSALPHGASKEWVARAREA